MKCASCTRGELLQEEHLVRPAHIRSSWELWHGEPSQTAFTLTGGNKRGLCIFNITIVIKSHGSASLSHSKTSLCFWLPGWQIYNQSVDKEFLGWKVLLLPWMSPCGWDFFTFHYNNSQNNMYTYVHFGHDFQWSCWRDTKLQHTLGPSQHPTHDVCVLRDKTTVHVLQVSHFSQTCGSVG